MFSVIVGNIDIPKTNREEKGKSIIGFPASYCVLDIETTGLSPEWDEIIEIGAIKIVDGIETERFQSLVQPLQSIDGEYVDSYITELTGITNEMLAEAPNADQVIPQFASFLGNNIIVGYNVSFDVNFLYDAFEKYLQCPLSNDYIDVMRLAKRLHPEMQHHRLKDMVDAFDIEIDKSHRAISDVEATIACYTILCDDVCTQYKSREAFVDSFKKRYAWKQTIRAENIIGDVSKLDPDNPLFQKNIVFTGKLEKFTRQQAMQIVADLGGINEDGITKHTNYLILGNNDYCKTIKDGKSSKQKKAENYKLKGQDIEILPENVFYDMIGENY